MMIYMGADVNQNVSKLIIKITEYVLLPARGFRTK